MFLFFFEYLKYRHIIFLSTFQNLTQVLKEKNICLVDTSINCFLFLLCFILLLSSENAWLPFPRHAIPGCLLGGAGLSNQLNWVNVSGTAVLRLLTCPGHWALPQLVEHLKALQLHNSFPKKSSLRPPVSRLRRRMTVLPWPEEWPGTSDPAHC